MKRASLSNTLRYRFDTLMTKGGVSIFIALVVVFLGVFVLLSLLRMGLLAVTETTEAPSRPGIAETTETAETPFWTTFLELTDPGSMSADDDSGFWFKTVAVLAGVSGLIGLAVLISFVQTAVNQRLLALRRGRSKVIEKGHTVILGWIEQRVIEICRELIVAKESESNARIVILAEHEKQHMDDVLRLHLTNTKSTRIVTRSGNISSLAMLDVVSVETCKSVIVLAQCEGTAPDETKAASDAKVIQTLLAVTSRRRSDRDLNIVSEIFDPAYRHIVQETFPENVVCVEADDALARILVQTSRSVGLSVVYNEVLSFNGAEMYFVRDDWGEVTFGELAFRFPDGVPMGLRSAEGRIVLNPEVDDKLKADDDVLILATDDSQIRYLQKPVAQTRDLDLVGDRLERRRERELILGWTHQTEFVLEQYDEYVEPGSRIDVMLRAPSEAVRKTIAAVGAKLHRVQIGLIEKDRLSGDDLRSVEPFEYDNIIILAEEGEDGDTLQVDSENIVTLLLLRDIRRDIRPEGADTKLIIEILDSQNYELVAEAGVNDVIISNRLISMMLAQISESVAVKQVYDQLFQEEGSEIYVKPARQYVAGLPAEVTFADLMRLAQKRKEVCLGVKIKALETDTGRNSGVTLIPDKTRTFQLEREDSLVVLAETER